MEGIPLSFVTGFDSQVVEGEKTTVYYVTGDLKVDKFESTVPRQSWRLAEALQKQSHAPLSQRSYLTREAAEEDLAKEAEERIRLLAALVSSLRAVRTQQA